MDLFGFSDVIRSKDNPQIKLFKKLMTSKKERQAYGLFVLEGSRLVFDALKENAPVRKIFITETALESFGNRLSEFDLSGISVALVSDSVGDKMAGTDKTQGIFAECSFPEKNDKLGVLKKGGRYAVLYQLQDPGNAGMIIRTADAIGMDGVIFSESCDIYNPKVVRSTMGSLFRIPVYRNIPIDEVFMEADRAELQTCAAVVDSDALDVKTVEFDNGGVVFIGNEGNGLPGEVKNKCKKRITIKMNGNIDSLNAAMATGIMMWELTRND